MYKIIIEINESVSSETLKYLNVIKKMHLIIVLERLKIVVKTRVIQFMKKIKQISLLINWYVYFKKIT